MTRGSWVLVSAYNNVPEYNTLKIDHQKNQSKKPKNQRQPFVPPGPLMVGGALAVGGALTIGGAVEMGGS